MSRTFFRRTAPAPRAGACSAGGEAGNHAGDEGYKGTASAPRAGACSAGGEAKEDLTAGKPGNEDCSGAEQKGQERLAEQGDRTPPLEAKTPSERPTARNTTLDSGDGVERHAIIYDDTDVCRLLGLRRREIVKRRTKERRGIDWDVAGEHVGMTATWIRSWNRKADVRRLKPVVPGDGVVTVRVVGRVLNGDVVRGVRVADGTCVTVRGIRNAWYLHEGDELDCRMIGGGLAFDPVLNRESY